MPLRYKYSIADWVLTQDNVTPGDVVAYYDDNQKCEVHAEVLDLTSREKRQIINCRPLNSDKIETINFYDTIVYRIKSNTGQSPREGCSCGARFTSNPKYHLPYCEKKQVSGLN